jgi:anti-sigma factor RsiW
MADHDSIFTLIPYYANGTLSPEERRSVEQHLEECAECRALFEETVMTKELGLTEPDELLDHPHPQHLESFAVDSSSMEPAAAEWVRGHVERCGICRDALRILQSSAEEVVGEGGPRKRRTIWMFLGATILHPAAAAAYLIMIVLVIPAYRAFVEIPGNMRRVEAVRSWGGAVDLQVLSSAMRGEGSEVVVETAAAQPVLPLGAEFELPADISPSTVIAFEVTGEEDAVVWMDGIEAARVERNLNESGIVTLLLPASLFPSGSYHLRVSRSDRPSERALLEAGFVVYRQSPAATKVPQ